MEASVFRQIEDGKLCCPVTHERLYFDEQGTNLFTADRSHSYPVVEGTPILLADPGEAAKYVQGSRKMLREYSSAASPLVRWFKRWHARDYCTAASTAAFKSLFSDAGVYLSIGGGPVQTSVFDKPQHRSMAERRCCRRRPHGALFRCVG